MRFSSGFRAALVALFALAGAGVSSAARADAGTIWISELKGGWFIGASGGSGTLIFHGRRYPLSIGGLSAGLVFGASETSPGSMGALALAPRSWSGRGRSCYATKRAPC
jgi:hypothetical protein